MYLAVTICLVLILVLYVAVRLLCRRRKLPRLPRGPKGLPRGPKGFPFIGTLRLDDHLTVWDHREKYGDISCVTFAGVKLVYLHTVEAIRASYTNREGVFEDREDSFGKVLIVDKDVLLHSSHEEYWPKLRKMMVTKLRAYGDGIEHIEDVVIGELDCLSDVLTQRSGTQFDILDLLKKSLCNILLSLMIGERFEYDSRMIYVVERLCHVENSLSGAIMSTFIVMFPWVQYLPVKLGAKIREIKQLRAEFMDLIFARGVDLHDEQSGIFFDFLRAKKHSDWLEDTHIKGMMDDFFAAGLSTTSSSLYAFFEVLLRYPDVQTRLQQEIDDVIGTQRHPSVSDRKNMPYTEATIIETLRFTAIVTLVIPKRCEHDTTLLGYDIPKGSQVWANLFRVHHDPNIWPDSWTFDPTRFLDEKGQLLPPNHPVRMNMIAFGGGARICVAAVLARTRLFLYITHLLQRFSFLPGDKLPPCDPRDYVDGLASRPRRYEMVVVER